MNTQITTSTFLQLRNISIKTFNDISPIQWRLFFLSVFAGGISVAHRVRIIGFLEYWTQQFQHSPLCPFKILCAKIGIAWSEWECWSLSWSKKTEQHNQIIIIYLIVFWLNSHPLDLHFLFYFPSKLNSLYSVFCVYFDKRKIQL